MKKLSALILVMAMLFSASLISCSDSGSGSKDDGSSAADTTTPVTDAVTTVPEATDTLTGTPEELYNQLADKSGAELGMVDGYVITAADAANTLGLNEADFDKYVSEAYVSQAMISSFAHMISVIKAKDADSAKAVKDLLASSFDPRRWVCVTPNQCIVIESGSYVLFIASANDVVNPFVSAFKALAGSNCGELNTFFVDEYAE